MTVDNKLRAWELTHANFGNLLFPISYFLFYMTYFLFPIIYDLFPIILYVITLAVLAAGLH